MKLFLKLVIISLFVFFPKVTHAHIAGQPPFFLMNDKYADYYPVYSTSLTDFTLPQDLAPDLYLINEPIVFEIDEEILPFPPEVIEQITYTWDFGDGTTGEGTENRHTYTKPGSYLLTVNADYGEYSDPNTVPVIQAVLLHVLPERDYKLPEVTIKINEQVISDPIIDTVSFPQGEELTFSAQIEEGTTEVVSYFWDKGNGVRAEEQEFSHTYTANDPAYLFPFVRVTDANGFIVDTYAQIENSSTEGSSTQSGSWIQDNALLLLIAINSVILLSGGFLLLRKNKK